MTVSIGTGILPPTQVHTEADIARLLRQFLPELPESGERGVHGRQLPPFRDLVAEVAHDDIAVAGRLSAGPMLKGSR